MRWATALGIAVAAVLAVAGPTPVGASTRVPTRTTFSYGTAALQTVTVYRPTTPTGPSVVLVHGGGFRSSAGEARKLAIYADNLAADGDTVFVVNYRTDAGGVGIAGQVADVVAGTQWTLAHAAGFGARPDRLTIIGGSSGGLLAEDATLQLDAAAPGTVKAVISLSGTQDFATAFSYWLAIPGPAAQLHVTNLADVLGCTYVRINHVRTYTCPMAVETRYSPDLQVVAADCPAQWLILNGDNEEQPVAQARAMADALTAAGCQDSLDIFHDSAHAFDYWFTVLNQLQATIAAT